MIYTLTANPSLDYMVEVRDFKEGETNRSKRADIVPGGKGLNVASVLHTFNVPVKALGIIAGFTGQEWIRLVRELGVDADVIELSEGQTRINVKLMGDKETEVNASGPALTPEKWEELMRLTDPIGAGDWLCVSGSACPGMSPDAYASLMQMPKERGAKIIVDAAGEQMRNALRFRPFLVKPNRRELEGITDTVIETEEDLIRSGKLLLGMGALNVLVSAGKDGAYWIGEDGVCYRIPAPAGQVKNTVGSGDTMVAAFLYGCESGLSREEILRLTVAAGSAGAFSENLVTKAEVYDILDSVKIEKIEGNGRKERFT